MKIGVFICHCGSNIAGTVDCGKVAEIAKTYPDVAFSTDLLGTRTGRNRRRHQGTQA